MTENKENSPVLQQILCVYSQILDNIKVLCNHFEVKVCFFLLTNLYQHHKTLITQILLFIHLSIKVGETSSSNPVGGGRGFTLVCVCVLMYSACESSGGS